MTNPLKKMELPSVSKKKKDAWHEMKDLYTTSYNQLTHATATIGVIIANKQNYGSHVNLNVLENMVVPLSRNMDKLRDEINSLYQEINNTNLENINIMDVNMACIQHAHSFSEWGNRFVTLCAQPLDDIVSYVQPQQENTHGE